MRVIDSFELNSFDVQTFAKKDISSRLPSNWSDRAAHHQRTRAVQEGAAHIDALVYLINGADNSVE